MEFKEFTEKIKDLVAKELPTDCNITLQEVAKNNKTLTGIAVRKEMSVSAPVIYLNDYYKDYCDGEITLEEVKNAVLRVYTNGADLLNMQEISALITNFEAVKDLIYPQVICTEGNQDFLQNKVTREFLDLSVTYRIQIPTDGSKSASVPITRQILDQYGASEEQIFELAIKNQRNRGITMVPMSEIMRRMGMPEIFLSQKDPLHVVSNSDLHYGAALLLDNEVMHAISEEIGGDFTIIPSSIHELIIIADKDLTADLPAFKLVELVKEVNASEVKPTEVLADNVYHYDIQSREVTVADDKGYDLD